MIFNFDEIVKLGNAVKSTTTDLDELVKMTSNMSLEQSLAVLSTKKLSEEDKQLILLENGLISAENNKTIAMKTSTNALATYTAGLKANAKAWALSIVKNPVTWITAIGVAIYGVVKVIKYFNDALDRQKEKLEETKQAFDDAKSNLESVNNELKTAKERMHELQSMGSLSFVEAEELDKLKDTVEELTIAADIADKIAKKEAINLSKENEKTYNQEYGKYNNSSDKVQDIYNNPQNYTFKDGDLSTTLAALLYTKDQLDKYTDEYNNAILSDNDDFAENLLITKNDLEEQVSSIEDSLLASINTLQTYKTNAENAGDTTSDYYKSILKDMKLIYEYYDSAKWNTTEFESIFNTSGIEKTKSELVSMYEAGELDSETIAQYKNLNKALLESDFILGENEKAIDLFIQQIASMANEASKAAPEVADLLSITDTVNNINNKLKPALDSLAGIYTTLFDKENGYEWQIIDIEEFASIGSELDSLKEKFQIDIPVDDYEKFVTILSDASTTSEQAQQAFNDLASSMINNSNVVELTDENFDLLRNSLENLGITNAADVLEYKLRVEMEKLENEEEALSSATADSTEKIYEQSKAFVDQANMTDLAKLELLEMVAKETIFASTELNIESKIERLAALASAYMGVSDAVEYLNSQTNATVSGMGQDSRYSVPLEQAWENLRSKYFDNYEYEFDFKYDGNTTGDNKDKYSSKDTKETFDWIETLISRIQRNITNLGKVVSATYRNWSTRNNALAQEMGEINKEINAQMTAYNAYMQKANSVPLAEGYKELVRSGAYKISEITDEKLKEQIQEYEEWYKKALNASDAIEDLRANLADLAKTKFDNVSARYDEQIFLITHNVSMLEGFVSQSEAAGYMASEVYYKAMAEKQQENIAQLQGEYSSLLSAFDEAVKSGAIQKYSSDWYEMLSAINDVELEIQSATTELIEFNQTLQQLSWEVFDKIQDSVSGIIEEANFLIDVLDSKDLHTDKGTITDEGLAVQGLHAVNYNTYMEQALAYADEMAKIESEMAKDPYDMELVDRRNELLGLQQEAIQNAIDEKTAIRDLDEDGYNKMLDSLQKVIDKRKELLNSQKDLYDYENSISEQTNEVAKFKKQIEAYKNDTSEAGRATLQKLYVNLESAEKSLKESEYERYLSDQERLLDDLMLDAETFVNERLDNIDGLISEAVDATNKNAETISNTIHEASNAYGYKLSDQMETIWDYEESAIDGVTTIVSVYGDILSDGNKTIADNITNGTTSVVNAISGLNTSMRDMVNKLDGIATANANSIAQAQSTVASGQSNSYGGNHSASDYTVSTSNNNSTNDGSSNNSSTASNSNTVKKAEKKNKERHQKWEAYIGSDKIGEYATEQEAKDASISEINKRAEKAAKDASSRASGSPAVQIYNSVKKATIDELTKKNVIKIPAYASGTPNAKKGWAVVGEDGNEIIIDKDGNTVLTLSPQLLNLKGGEQIINGKETAELLKPNLLPLSSDQLWGNIVKTPKLPEMVGRGNNANVANDIQLNIAVKADNFDEFCTSFKTAIKDDPQCRKLLRAVTIDETVGRGGLRRNSL